jgi:uncharacterized Zn-finger protein
MAITKHVPFPLDEEGFFRRACPLCSREFKVLLKPDELGQLQQLNYLVDGEESEEKTDEEDDEKHYFCPYCGQRSPHDEWWTEEQRAYIHVIVSNIAATLLNEHFVRPLRSMNSDFIKITSNEMPQKEAWISPEASDLTRFDLPCCVRSLKIAEEWTQEVHCFFCGFPHNMK